MGDFRETTTGGSRATPMDDPRETPMDLTARASDLAGALSFLAQWALYRIVASLEPLRERLSAPGRDGGLPGTVGRDETLWAFGARGGEAFADNAKYLYLHATAEHPDVRPVWLSKDREVVADLQSAGYEAYHCYSVRGLLLNLRAGVVFLTQGHRDLAMPCCGGAFAVLLWHGVPLKHVSWDAGFRDLPAPVRAAHAHMAGEFDLLTIPGASLADTFASGLRVDPDRMAVVGYPRNDALFDPVPGEEVGTDAAALDLVRSLADDHAVVCYLPTFRDWTDESVLDHVDLPELDAFLAERDAYLAFKPHPKERATVPDDCSRVVRLPGATDPYPLLRHADVLVTDYSSVYVDYLLLDRPVVFYPFDLDRYRDERGFYVDYESVTPGPVARSFDGLLAGLDRALADPDADAPARAAVRERLLDDGTVEAGDDTRPGRQAADDDARPGSRAAAVYDVVVRRLADRERETARRRRSK